MISHTTGRTWNDGVQVQSIQEHIWTQGKESNKRLKKAYDEEFYIGFEFLITVTMSQRIRQARNWESLLPASCCFLAWFVFLTLRMEAASSFEILL